MEKLKIDEQLYQRLKAVRENVRAKFEELRIPGESEHVSGKDRLERVPALRSREFKRYLVGINGDLMMRKAAWRLLDFLRGRTKLSSLARDGVRSTVDDQLDRLRQSEDWLKAESQLAAVLGDSAPDGVSAIKAAGASSTQQVGEGSLTRLDHAPEPTSPGADPRDSISVPTGKNTGARRNHISELCHIEAEWRHTNLGPNEGRWLQLLLRFNRSYTRERVHMDVELDVHVHRIHVEAVLDGGMATPRDAWIETASPSGDKARIFEGNGWAQERPCYEVDNPVRSSPLSGNYDLFDLCEVNGEVGARALLEVSASIGGISISLPPEIKDQLDPTSTRPYDTPELRLIEGWLRDRTVPRSRLKGGGLYQLTQIELTKRLP